jgi:hypothetical protein
MRGTRSCGSDGNRWMQGRYGTIMSPDVEICALTVTGKQGSTEARLYTHLSDEETEVVVVVFL